MKRNEMLLAAQGLVAASSVGKALFALQYEGPFALRHVNIPAMTRTGFAALKVYQDSSKRKHTQPPEWDQLLVEVAPWNLDWSDTLRRKAAEGSLPTL